MKKLLILFLLCCMLTGCAANQPVEFDKEDIVIETSSTQNAHHFYNKKIEELFEESAYGFPYFDQYDILHVRLIKNSAQHKDLLRYIEAANGHLYSIGISSIEYEYDIYSCAELTANAERLKTTLETLHIPFRTVWVDQKANRIAIAAENPDFWYRLVIREFIDLDMVRFETTLYQPM